VDIDLAGFGFIGFGLEEIGGDSETTDDAFGLGFDIPIDSLIFIEKGGGWVAGAEILGDGCPENFYPAFGCRLFESVIHSAIISIPLRAESSSTKVRKGTSMPLRCQPTGTRYFPATKWAGGLIVMLPPL